MINLRNMQIFVQAKFCPRIFHFRTGETDGNADELAIYTLFVKCFPVTQQYFIGSITPLRRTYFCREI